MPERTNLTGVSLFQGGEPIALARSGQQTDWPHYIAEIAAAPFEIHVPYLPLRNGSCETDEFFDPSNLSLHAFSDKDLAAVVTLLNDDASSSRYADVFLGGFGMAAYNYDVRSLLFDALPAEDFQAQSVFERLFNYFFDTRYAQADGETAILVVEEIVPGPGVETSDGANLLAAGGTFGLLFGRSVCFGQDILGDIVTLRFE